MAATIKSFITGAPFLAVDLTRDHNCREKREKKKLQEEHPDEADVVVCRRPEACYIKGKLQPTRSFGDFYLKYSEFMRSPSQHASAGKYISPPYTPPYITATPEITVSKLRPGVDDFLILGTDGLWDFLSSQEAVSIAGAVLRGEGGNSEKAAEALQKVVLSRAAEKSGLDPAELEKLPVGRERRRRHDDTTIIVVDLKRAFEFFWWG
jgi:pyruvate dehydrogenase phosphatase